MNREMDRILASKNAFRQKLARLPFEEKIVILEKLRDQAKELGYGRSTARTRKNTAKNAPKSVG